jgi:hypothetical protein
VFDPLLPYAYLLAEYYLQHTINIIVQVIMHVRVGCGMCTINPVHADCAKSAAGPAELIFFHALLFANFHLLNFSPLYRHSLSLSFMQAIRLARPRVSLRRLATTAQVPTSGPSSVTASVIPLSNVEAQWENMSKSEQAVVHRQLEELQKKDWKTLSMDEKKAGACCCPSALRLLPLTCLTDVLMVCCSIPNHALS